MKLKDLKNKYFGNVFDELPNEFLVKETEEWSYHSSIALNGIIAIGWFLNDDILVINVDGIYIYDILKKDFIYRDYETSFKEFISDDNLTYFVQSKNEKVNIFGLRGGGGNLLTKDNTWKLELVEIAWNIKVIKVLNYKNRKASFLDLHQNSFEGNKYLGFSKSEKYFAIMGDCGVDIFFNKL